MGTEWRKVEENWVRDENRQRERVRGQREKSGK